jgi:hypothetical protein
MIISFSSNSPKKGDYVSSLTYREEEKKKQKPTASVGRKKGGDQTSKRNGH